MQIHFFFFFLPCITFLSCLLICVYKNWPFFVVIIVYIIIIVIISTDLVVDCLLAKGLQVCYIYVLNNSIV